MDWIDNYYCNSLFLPTLCAGTASCLRGLGDYFSIFAQSSTLFLVFMFIIRAATINHAYISSRANALLNLATSHHFNTFPVGLGSIYDQQMLHDRLNNYYF